MDISDRNKAIDDCFKGKVDGGMKSFYYEIQYPFYAFIWHQHLEYRDAAKLLHVQKDESILEVGASYPNHLKFSYHVGPKGRYVGLDMTTRTVHRANAKLQRKGINDYVYHSVGDAYNLSCPDGLFDKVLSVNFWTKDLGISGPPTEFYEGIWRVLRPGGKLIESFIIIPPIDSTSLIVTAKLEDSGYTITTSEIHSNAPFCYQQIMVATKPE